MNPCRRQLKIHGTQIKSECAPWIKNTAPLDNKERCAIKGIMVKKKTED